MQDEVDKWVDMMVEVIEPNWHKFEAAFRKVRTVDEVLKIHTDFVDSCLHECMLTDPRLVRVFIHHHFLCCPRLTVPPTLHRFWWN